MIIKETISNKDICKIIKLYSYIILYHIAKNIIKYNKILENEDINPQIITTTLVNLIKWDDIKNNTTNLTSILSKCLDTNNDDTTLFIKNIIKDLEQKFTIKQLFENIITLDTYFQKNDNLPNKSKTYIDSLLILDIIKYNISKSKINNEFIKYLKINHFPYNNKKPNQETISKNNIIFILCIIIGILFLTFILYILYTHKVFENSTETI